MDTSLFKLIRAHFDAVQAKNLKAVLSFYHHDVDFIDPHYPKVHMKGKNEVSKGLTWSFKTVKSFSFNTINYFENKEGTGACVEYATIITLFNGKQFKHQQAFIIETNHGKISRLQAYQTYGPHGLHKIILVVTRLIHLVKHFFT